MDIRSALGAVVREVRDGERDGRPTRTVVATRSYDTTPEDLWDALTNADRIPRWFLPISGNLELGGRYKLKGNAGGEIKACEKPSRLEVTWEFGEQLSWVEVRLTPEADGTKTRLVLEHTAPIDPHWEKFGPGAVGVGWDLTLFGLERYLAMTQWLASEEAKAFMRESSEGWRKANIESGVDEKDATESAERTTKFYTGT